VRASHSSPVDPAAMGMFMIWLHLVHLVQIRFAPGTEIIVMCAPPLAAAGSCSYCRPPFALCDSAWLLP
jgi:hypothetical protein